MEDNSYLPDCSDDDVLQFGSTMFRVGKVREAVKFAFTDPNVLPDKLEDALRQKGVNTNKATIIESLRNGANCELLRLGAKGWQTGKFRIRVSVEFCPDKPEIAQPESPLDDIRRMMNENS